MFTEKQFRKGFKFVVFFANVWLLASQIRRDVGFGHAMLEIAFMFVILVVGGTTFGVVFCQKPEESNAKSTSVVAEADKTSAPEVMKS